MTPVFGPYNTGMVDIRNSSYMNSVMQCLFSFPEFYSKYAQDHQKNCKRQSAECFQCQMQKLAYGLASGKYSQKKLLEKVIDEDMTEEEKKEEETEDEYYHEGIRPWLFKTIVE